MSEKNIYHSLKKQIIFLEHTPGKVMREKEIMKEFGVSRTPVREALMRLEMDGLVRIIPNVGSIVEDVSFQQLKNIFETRSHLMQLASQLAAKRITQEELVEIRQRIDQMGSEEDSKTLMQLDGEIHSIINKATKNDVLVKILEGLDEQALRIWLFSGAEGDYWKSLEKDLDEIFAALEQRDEALTVKLMDKHTKRFLDHIRSQLSF